MNGKKILIISLRKKEKPAEVHTLLRDKNIQLETTSLDDMVIILSENKYSISFSGIKTPLEEFDMFYARHIPLELTSIIKVLYPTVQFVQGASISWGKNKLLQYSVLSKNAHAIPLTVYIKSQNSEFILNEIEKHLQYPFVVKGWTGYGGNNVFLLENHIAAEEFLSTTELDLEELLYQELIPNLFDYRVLVVNGLVKFVCKKVRQTNEWRNNASLGAEEVIIPLEEVDQNILNLAVKSVNCTGLQIAGFDIVADSKTGRVCIFEVNSFPGCTYGSGEAKAISDYIAQLVFTH